ncbi:MAG: prepilin peptidase [Planctomycetes bacterium]|nr:prepilin peptidase [Planctomycetota bacterium]
MTEVFEIIKSMPPWFWLAWWFVVGSFVGSFINVVVYRLPRNCLSINNPKRSFCPSCKTQLKWKDNLPIVGWLWLRGKCRYCGVKFSIRYPGVELVTALLFLLAAWRVLYADGNISDQWQAWLTVFHIVAIAGVMLPWGLIDFDLTYIPHRLTFGPLLLFVPLGAHYHALNWGLDTWHSNPGMFEIGAPQTAVDHIPHLLFQFEPLWLNSIASVALTGVCASLALFFIGKIFNVVFRRRVKEIGGESIHRADIYLMLLLGVMLGWPKLIAAFFLAIFLGAGFGIIQIAMKRGHGTPFGPYLAFGTIGAALFMDVLMGVYNWYMNLLQNWAT